MTDIARCLICYALLYVKKYFGSLFCSDIFTEREKFIAIDFVEMCILFYLLNA